MFKSIKFLELLWIYLIFLRNKNKYVFLIELGFKLGIWKFSIDLYKLKFDNLLVKLLISNELFLEKFVFEWNLYI